MGCSAEKRKSSPLRSKGAGTTACSFGRYKIHLFRIAGAGASVAGGVARIRAGLLAVMLFVMFLLRSGALVGAGSARLIAGTGVRARSGAALAARTHASTAAAVGWAGTVVR